MTVKKHKPCLVLNTDYTPISVISWKTSISWYFKIRKQTNPAIEIIKFHSNDMIVGCQKMFRYPSVIKINQYLNINRQSVKFSRKNLFLRDNNTCQYCGKQYPSNKLTYDHVIPKSKWQSHLPATNWNNIVTACSICNRKKANKTPLEAKMKLLNNPKQPNFNLRYLPWYQDCSNIEYINEWSMFIPKEFIHENKLAVF